MLKHLPILMLAAACPLVSTVQASDLDAAVSRFISEDGFAQQDAAQVDEKLLSAFPSSSAMRPDSNVSVLEKALLLVDTLEGTLPRARYMVRYGQMMDPDSEDAAPLSFVTVERYNFGPIIHKSVVEDYGAENAADISEFGVGPHIAWRIVATPIMGQEAAILEVARKEISDEEAERNDCAGRPCLSQDTLDDFRLWDEIAPRINLTTAYDPTSADDIAVPARAVAEIALVAALSDGDGKDVTWRGPEHPEAARGSTPFLFVMVDKDLGQDTALDAALGQTLLNDDAIAELWTRRIEFPGSVYWMNATVNRNR